MSDISLIVTYRGGNTTISLPEGAKVLDVLEQLKLFADAHIVLRGKSPVPITETVRDGETLKVIKVASGG